MTTETTPIDLEKLTTQAAELRGAMVDALSKAEDNTVRKLGNELAQINRQILDIESGAQSDARTEFMGVMHDALTEFEVGGQTLRVQFAHNEDGQQEINIAYTPTPDTIASIKAIIAGIDRPSTATRWTYSWEKGDDDKLYPSFDFGKGTRKPTSTTSNGDGTRSLGWRKDGSETSLGSAFNACATAAQKIEEKGKSTGSQKYSFKVQVVGKAGYTKK